VSVYWQFTLGLTVNGGLAQGQEWSELAREKILGLFSICFLDSLSDDIAEAQKVVGLARALVIWRNFISLVVVVNSVLSRIGMGISAAFLVEQSEAKFGCNAIVTKANQLLAQEELHSLTAGHMQLPLH
jgi:hypothetical protein